MPEGGSRSNLPRGLQSDLSSRPWRGASCTRRLDGCCQLCSPRSSEPCGACSSGADAAGRRGALAVRERINSDSNVNVLLAEVAQGLSLKAETDYGLAQGGGGCGAGDSAIVLKGALHPGLGAGI